MYAFETIDLYGLQANYDRARKDSYVVGTVLYVNVLEKECEQMRA